MKKQLVLTGIPKSGTTYLCSILHNFSNVVMLSEPPMLDLCHKPVNEGVQEFFDYWHDKVLNKEEVPNKFAADGTLVKDYRTERWKKPSGVHEFDNKDFIFGIKNPRVFINRLPGIIEDMPEARKAVIIRNPYDTIGSFRRFQGGMNIGAGQKKLEEYYKTDFDEIHSTPAKLWKFWTDIVIGQLKNIIFIRYQDAVLKPKETIARIFGGWSPGKPLKPITPSEIRYSRECMFPGDAEEVERYCKENAKILGVW